MRQRSEDDIIAWTWKTFFENTTNPSVLLRLPMTKAAVRAMVNKLTSHKDLKIFVYLMSLNKRMP